MDQPVGTPLYALGVVYKGSACQLQLTPPFLVLSPTEGSSKNAVLELPWYDVYGVEAAWLRLAVHTLETSKGLKRKAHVYPMVLTNSESGPAVVTALSSWIATCRIEETVARRRLLGLVNPFSGHRKGRTIYANAKHMFDRAGFLDVTMKETEHRYHAREMAHSLALAEYDGLVCVSGDGLVNEVVKGLLTRRDWAQARTLPVGIIPAGSGNGTLRSLDIEDAEGATLAIIKGHTEPFGIVCYTTAHGVVYSHLELLWALISDAEFQSEGMRWLGPIRQEICAFIRIVFLRHYPAMLKWLPAEPQPVTTPPEYNDTDPHLGHGPKRQITDPSSDSGRENWQECQGYFSIFSAMNVAYPAADFCIAPYASHHDGTIDLIFSTRSCRGAFLTSLMHEEAAAHVGHKDICYEKCKVEIPPPPPCCPRDPVLCMGGVYCKRLGGMVLLQGYGDVGWWVDGGFFGWGEGGGGV